MSNSLRFWADIWAQTGQEFWNISSDLGEGNLGTGELVEDLVAPLHIQQACYYRVMWSLLSLRPETLRFQRIWDAVKNIVSLCVSAKPHQCLSKMAHLYQKYWSVSLWSPDISFKNMNVASKMLNLQYIHVFLLLLLLSSCRVAGSQSARVGTGVLALV